MKSPTLVLLCESADHWPALRAIVLAGRVTGPKVHDARIAALCRQHGVRELWTADRDFSDMSGVNALNPMIGKGAAD